MPMGAVRVRPKLATIKPLINQICPNCQTTISWRVRKAKCQACGTNLEFYFPDGVDFNDAIIPRQDMWRYQNLLPVNKKSIISAGEGHTPIINLFKESKKLKVDLFIKDESRNPTGTFKDREASLVISRSKDLGQNDLVLQSTGNTGLAITYYAGLAGLRSYFFGPKISRYKLFLPSKKPHNKIILIDGTPQEIKNYAENFAQQFNFNKISPFSERCEANATLAYEDYEAGFRADYYFQTVAAGMGPIGYYTGYQRLAQWGLVRSENLPKIMAVQLSEFNPLYRGWCQRKTTLSEHDNMVTYPKHPFEPTLFTTNAPAYYPQFKKIITDSGGAILEVTPGETKQVEKRLIAALAEININLKSDVEKSPFIGFAGLIKAVKLGLIPPKSRVLLLVTGRGAHLNHQIEPDAIIKPDYPPKKLLENLKNNYQVGVK
jgi:threonine synthase